MLFKRSLCASSFVVHQGCIRGASRVHQGCIIHVQVSCDPKTCPHRNFTLTHHQDLAPMVFPSPMHLLSIPYHIRGWGCGWRVGGFLTTHSDFGGFQCWRQSRVFNVGSNLICLIIKTYNNKQITAKLCQPHTSSRSVPHAGKQRVLTGLDTGSNSTPPPK